MAISPNQLEAFLFSAVDELRGTADAREAMGYLTGLLYLRFLLIGCHQEAPTEGNLEDGKDGFLACHLPQGVRWDEIKQSLHPQEHLRRAIHAFEEVLGPRFNEFAPALSLIDLLGKPELCRRLVTLVSALNLEGLQSEKLAELADKLIEVVAAVSGTHGGEFYTPMHISALMTGLLNPGPGGAIYDPACGTGNFLLAAHRYAQIKAQGAVEPPTRIVGQDINTQTAALAQLNVLLHDVPSAVIESGDSLLRPLPEQLVGRGFDLVLSNPPSGLQHDERTLEELRRRRDDFRYGPPTRVADFNFIQHALAALKNTGRAALLVGLRPLFIRGQEGEIRRALIESDVVEAVIVLPENLLPHTGAPSVILMLNKNKPEERRGRIRFVDASREFRTEGRRRILATENQQKIIEAVLSSEDWSRVAATVSTQEVSANEFVLLPARYIRIEEVEVVLGSDAEWITLARLANVFKGTKLGQSPEGNIPVLQGRDLSVLGLQVDALEKKDVPPSLPNVVRSQAGDILVQRIGQKPRAFLVEEDLTGVIISDTVYVVRFHEDDRPRARYIVEFLNSDRGQAKMTVGIAGAVVPTLRVTGLRELRIPLPNRAVIDLVEDLHEVERALISRVDKARDIRHQLFSVSDPEQFNAQLQNLSVEAQVLSKSIVDADDLEFQIRNYYPYVLAYPYRSLRAYPDASALYKEQLRVAENILAFLGCVGLALAAWTGALSGDEEGLGLSPQTLRANWQGGISPGHWRDMAHKAATLLRGREQFAAVVNFSNLWFKGRGTKESQFGSLMKEFVSLKNDFKHDRGPQTAHEYVAAVQNMTVKLDQCLQEVSFFVQHPMRLVYDSDVDWQTKKTVMKTLVYAGDHPGLRQEQITLDEPLPKDKLYFEVKEETLASLYPLVSVHYCDSCKTRETYIIDRYGGSDGRTVLKSFERGHTHDNDSAAKRVGTDFEFWLEKTFQVSR